MDFVDITLAGRVYKLRFVPDDITDICRRMTSFQPVGAGKVTTTDLGQYLIRNDTDAFQFCLWGGLRHIAQFKDIDAMDAQKLISAHIKGGGQYSDLRLGIFRGLVKCGLAEFAPALKFLEDEEAKRLENGAIEMTATELADAEEDRGNGLTPMSNSPMRSSALSSPVVASE